MPYEQKLNFEYVFSSVGMFLREKKVVHTGIALLTKGIGIEYLRKDLCRRATCAVMVRYG
jgi:hypothetical protein